MTSTTIHGIALEPTRPPERYYLGTHKGYIEIDGVRYTVRPTGDGGADLFGLGPRESVYSPGTHFREESQLRLDADGSVSCCGEPVGRIVGGQFEAE
jgi:hypothetical protein